jgi:cytochrome P450
VDVNQEKSRTVPAHVDPKLVVEFDLFEVPAGMGDPLDKWRALIDARVPPIFWSPFNGGHWTFLGYEDIREAYRNHDAFSTRHNSIPPVSGMPVLQPNSVDPPDHMRFRSLLAPLFTPSAVAVMKDEIRRRAAALIDSFAAAGQCDFVARFSSRLPSGVFIHLMGMDESRLEEFTGLADVFMRVDEPIAKAQNIRDIYVVLEEFFAGKQHALGSDIASVLVRARDTPGGDVTHEEIINCAFLLFLAGLDTVTSTMTYIWRYLAMDSSARAQIAASLLDRPQVLSRAIDELFRVNAVSNIYRRVTHDLDYKGVHLKANDMVVLPNNLANRDPAIFDVPTEIQLDRKINTHLTFGLGVHRCLGSHLAKLEVAASLQEWLPRIPEFRLGATDQIKVFAGPVMGLRSLPLEWEVAA